MLEGCGKQERMNKGVGVPLFLWRGSAMMLGAECLQQSAWCFCALSQRHMYKIHQQKEKKDKEGKTDAITGTTPPNACNTSHISKRHVKCVSHNSASGQQLVMSESQ